MGRQVIKLLSALFFAITASAVLYVGYWYMNIERAKKELTQMVQQELGYDVTYAFMQPMGFPRKVKFRFDDVRIVTPNSKIQFDQLFVDASLLGQNSIVVNLPKTFNLLLKSDEGTHPLRVSMEGGDARFIWGLGPHKVTVSSWNLSVRDSEGVYLSGADFIMERLANKVFPHARESKWLVSMNNMGLEHPKFQGIGKFYENVKLDAKFNRLTESEWISSITKLITSDDLDDMSIAHILKPYTTPELMEIEEAVFKSGEKWFSLKGTVGQDDDNRLNGRITLITNRTPEFMQKFVGLDMLSSFDMEDNKQLQYMMKQGSELQTLKLEGRQGRFIFNGKPFENAPYLADVLTDE